MKESQIKHEAGNYWVGQERRAVFTVYKSCSTHAVADSSYDDLSLAICRCDYLAKNKK